MKTKDLAQLPYTRYPGKALRKIIDQDSAKAARGKAVVCTRLHRGVKTAAEDGGAVLAVEVWSAEKGLMTREFFDGSGARRLFLSDGGAQNKKGQNKTEKDLHGELWSTSGKFLGNVVKGKELIWASSADAKRIRDFFAVPEGRAPGAAEMIYLVEHGRKNANGRFTAKGCGAAGGYRPEELFCDEPPKNWKDVMRAHGMGNTPVLVCEKTKMKDPLTGMRRKAVLMKCSACGWVEMRDELTVSAIVKDGCALSVCPHCNQAVWQKFARKSKVVAHENGSLLWFRRYGDTAIAQGYEVEWGVDNDAKEFWWLQPSHIYAFGPYGNYAFNNYYTWGMNHNREYFSGWVEYLKMQDGWCRGKHVVVMEPEQGALAGTPLENARIDVYAREFNGWMVPIRLAVRTQKLPALEALCDLRDWRAVSRILDGTIRVPNGETKPHRALGLTRPEYKRWRKEDWSADMLKVYKEAKASGWDPAGEDLWRITAILDNRLSDVVDLEQGKLGQVWRYLVRVTQKEMDRMLAQGCRAPAVTEARAIQQTLQTWIDYRNILNDLREEVDTTDKAFPYDLFRRHDRMVERQNAERQKALIEAKKEKRSAFRKMHQRICWADWEDGDYLIRAAKSTKELVKEGASLHHCVGGYTEAYLKGSVIFFLRRAADPEKAFFTLNLDIKTGRILQLRGMANCAPPEDVRLWAERWRDEIWAKGKKHAQKPADKKKKDAA